MADRECYCEWCNARLDAHTPEELAGCTAVLFALDAEPTGSSQEAPNG